MYPQTPYTYSKLIQGQQCAKRASEKVIAGLSANRKPSTDATALLAYHRGLIAYFDDEIARLSLARLVCGDTTAIIR